MNDEIKTNNKKEKSLPTCSCGHDRNHRLVQARGEYTFWGNILQSIGISYRPLKVCYLCLKCNKYFDETTDSHILNNFL